jgi:hypothetical protein
VNNQKINPNDQMPKSDEMRRVVTLTLPEKTLQLLETLDQDLERAIVKLTDIAMQKAFPQGSAFEIVKVAPRKSVFIVGTDTMLARIPWLKLVEVAPGRNLITIPSGTSLESLEIAILELIENIPSESSMERKLLDEFCKYVGRLRRNKKISGVEIIIVNVDD